MDPATGVSWICDHQTLVVSWLVWASGLAPVASAVAWWGAKKGQIPAPVMRFLQLLALNLVHAAAGEPVAAKKDVVVPFSIPKENVK